MPRKTEEGEPLIVPAGEDCELCKKRGDGICNNCGNKIVNKDPNMGTAGYQSIQPNHFHDTQPVFAELCYKCHRSDRLKVYGKSYGESE